MTCLELVKRQRLFVLDVAEPLELSEVVFMRALPGVIVWGTPETQVVGRTRVGIKWHRVVGPDTVRLQVLAPCRNPFRLVFGGRNEVGLHERYAVTRAHQ